MRVGEVMYPVELSWFSRFGNKGEGGRLERSNDGFEICP